MFQEKYVSITQPRYSRKFRSFIGCEQREECAGKCSRNLPKIRWKVSILRASVSSFFFHWIIPRWNGMCMETKAKPLFKVNDNIGSWVSIFNYNFHIRTDTISRKLRIDIGKNLPWIELTLLKVYRRNPFYPICFIDNKNAPIHSISFIFRIRIYFATQMAYARPCNALWASFYIRPHNFNSFYYLYIASDIVSCHRGK